MLGSVLKVEIFSFQNKIAIEFIRHRVDGMGVWEMGAERQSNQIIRESDEFEPERLFFSR